MSPVTSFDCTDAGARGVSHDFHRDYTLDSKIGQGAYGSVHVAKTTAGCRDTRSVAVKVIDLRVRGGDLKKAVSLRLGVQRELSVLRALPDSPNVVQFRASYFTRDRAYIVMELCSLDLLPALEGLKELSEQTLQPIFRDMMSGVAACHEAGLVHRDIKAANFVASPARCGLTVKLCDFGLASVVRDIEAAELTGCFGTPPYMAPEMVGGRYHGAKVDVWSVGVVAYVLLFGVWPYVPDTMTGPAMKSAIQKGDNQPRFRNSDGFPEVSVAGRQWLRALLCRDVGARPSAKAALHHAYFSQAWLGGACLRPVVRSAMRWGAFGALAGSRPPPPTEL